MTPCISTLKCAQLSSYNGRHEEWLQFAKKIRKGLGDGTALDDIREFIISFWQHHIQHHFLLEERIIIPLIKSSGLAAQFRKGHDDIRDLIRSLTHDSDRTLFSILANFIESHIRFEKYSIFNFLSTILSAEQLDAICNNLEKQSVICKKWKHGF